VGSLRSEDAFWRPSNQMGVLNTDLAKQLSAGLFGARLWRLMPGQASTRHRHVAQHELYIVLEGTGRIRVEQELLTLPALSTLLIEPGCVRQIFNDTDSDGSREHPRDDRRAARHALPGWTQSASARTLRHMIGEARVAR